MHNHIITLCFVLLLFGCKPDKTHDLAIKNVKVLNVLTGEIQSNKTILIDNGRIKQIINANQTFKAKDSIDGNNKLVTPSFIDTHIHPTDILGDYDKAPKTLHKDSLAIYRKRISDSYLPFGITTVLTMGQPDNWLNSMMQWQLNPNDSLVDYYLSGGAMISKDNRVPYIGHIEVTSAQLARQKIIEYHNNGVKHIKIYYRMKEPEFSTVVKVADSLKMTVFGHVGDLSLEYPSINYALNNGVKNIEHITVLGNNFFTSQKERDDFTNSFVKKFGALNSEPRIIQYFLEQFRYIEDNKQKEKADFIKLMVNKKATLSTTIYSVYDNARNSDTNFSKIQLERNLANFKLMMNFAKELHNKGVELRIATDMPDGGKVLLSELVILAKYGFNIADIFKIATINGAKAMRLENEIGSIDIGKKANLLIWSRNPFDNYENFEQPKIILKNGIQIK
jgi:imidazolonepropionase-like amidohydrolase